MKNVGELKKFLESLHDAVDIELQVDSPVIKGMELYFEITTGRLVLRPVFLTKSFIIDRK